MLLNQLRFANSFTKHLPKDPITHHLPRTISQACYSHTSPAVAPQPQLLAYSESVLKLLQLDHQVVSEPQFTNVFVGNELLPNMEPHASCYGGHQFGHWAGQLGDGRAINLGEVLTSSGERYTLQLKGAGPTPYSRSADGYAVLRSSLREFLCSEAMFHLGIATTRALSLITTGNAVIRDMFYDGNPKSEPGAVVCRVATSFIRFGHFEILTARKEYDLLKQLANYTIFFFFPSLIPNHVNQNNFATVNLTPEIYLEWFRQVCQRTCKLIIDWMRVGFVHGVLNTDNMSILGDTIDYGPYGWLDHFDPQWTPNTTDAQGKRYCYDRQGEIGLWNLTQLANAIYPLIQEAKLLETTLEYFIQDYEQQYFTMMIAKLGIPNVKVNQTESLKKLINQLQQMLLTTETDWTLFFTCLQQLNLSKVDSEIERMQLAFYDTQIKAGSMLSLKTWLQGYQKQLKELNVTEIDRQQMMYQTNPKFLLRNYLAQQAIDAAEQGDTNLLHTLLKRIQTPYETDQSQIQLEAKRPDWARTKPGCAMLSCSS